MPGFQHDWLFINQTDLLTERAQCEDEGKDVTGALSYFTEVSSLDLADPVNQPRAQQLLDLAASLPQHPDYPFDEPSDEIGIQSKVMTAPPFDVPPLNLAGAELRNRIHGAWLGRACGCLLGKPVEGWHADRMTGYLHETGRYPLSSYFSIDVPQEVIDEYDVSPKRPFIESVTCMPEDDDLNYTVTNLAIVKQHGKTFVPADVASFWMQRLPLLKTCTAERVAYRNLSQLIPPPYSASFRNPYREWIGAQIRGDLWGYISPGSPARAAEMAWRDASISHTRNGIYGAMWVAGMVATAFVTEDVRRIVLSGLYQVPSSSRFASAIHQVLDWHAEGVKYDDVVARLHQRWDEKQIHHWCHTVSNAMVVTIGLLWGDLDFERSICRAVQPCFDTDCNGATVGSIVGAIIGADKLPAKWTGPIKDTLETGVAGYSRVQLRDLAEETAKLAERP